MYTYIYVYIHVYVYTYIHDGAAEDACHAYLAHAELARTFSMAMPRIVSGDGPGVPAELARAFARAIHRRRT